MMRPTSPLSPVTEEKKRSRLSRIVSIAAGLIALVLLAKLAGWIFFQVSLVGLWDAVIHEQDVFELAVFLAGAVVVGLIVALWRVGQQRLARWESLVEPKEWPKLESELRASRLQVITTIAQIGGGTALIIGIYFTYQNLNATREGQITDRFIRAVDQLGGTNKDGQPAREIRLGGIYGLTRIAQDSSEDYAPVREIFNDYVRLNAPWHDADVEKQGQPPLGPPVPEKDVVHPEADIQAALDFVGYPIDKFEKATRTEVNLPYTDLKGVLLVDAHFRGADLRGAHMEQANLFGAHFEFALLAGTHLEGVDLTSAHLDSAFLVRAYLRGAQLYGTDLDHTVGLTDRQLDCTYANPNTKLPAGLYRPESWKPNDWLLCSP